VSKHTENYYSGSFEIERPLAEMTLGLRPRMDTAEAWRDAYHEVISKARGMGLTDDEIRGCIETDLICYNFVADTFPIDEWMET